jgi:hypothetical protein
MKPKDKEQEEILSEEEFCHYSGLPSPSAYQCTDYDTPTSKSSLEKITDKIKINNK